MNLTFGWFSLSVGVMKVLHSHESQFSLPDVILFQGDSITDAFRRPEEVSTAYQLGAGYALMVAGELAVRFSRRVMTFYNRGVSGNRITDIRKRWNKDCLALKPDLVSLLCGVNDTIHACPLQAGEAEIAEHYRFLIESTRSDNPEVQFILLEPFVLDCGIVRPHWRSHLRPRQELVREMSEEFQTAFVPLQALFDKASLEREPEYWTFDGVHPTHAGFHLIATAWRAAFCELYLMGEGLWLGQKRTSTLA